MSQIHEQIDFNETIRPRRSSIWCDKLGCWRLQDFTCWNSHLAVPRYHYLKTRSLIIVMSHYELRSSINTHFAAARFAPRFYRFNDTSCLVNDDLCECLRYVSFFRIDVKKKMAYIILLFPKKIPNMRKRLRIAMNW